LYCLWLLSYHEQVQKTMAVPLLFTNLCHLLRSCQDRDKVVRIVLSILKVCPVELSILISLEFIARNAKQENYVVLRAR
jgi:hypothetical protein